MALPSADGASHAPRSWSFQGNALSQATLPPEGTQSTAQRQSEYRNRKDDPEICTFLLCNYVYRVWVKSTGLIQQIVLRPAPAGGAPTHIREIILCPNIQPASFKVHFIHPDGIQPDKHF